MNPRFSLACVLTVFAAFFLSAPQADAGWLFGRWSQGCCCCNGCGDNNGSGGSCTAGTTAGSTTCEQGHCRCTPLSGSASTPTAACSKVHDQDYDNAPTYKHERILLNAINAVRERYGLHALILKRSLHLQARRHCGWMANHFSMTHSNDTCAENIAMGQADANDVMDAWMNLPGHRANILNPAWRSVGVAGYTNDAGTPFWCQQFSSEE
jgi:uncharacterized protein YkwD